MQTYRPTYLVPFSRPDPSTHFPPAPSLSPSPIAIPISIATPIRFLDLVGRRCSCFSFLFLSPEAFHCLFPYPSPSLYSAADSPVLASSCLLQPPASSALATTEQRPAQKDSRRPFRCRTLPPVGGVANSHSRRRGPGLLTEACPRLTCGPPDAHKPGTACR